MALQKTSVPVFQNPHLNGSTRMFPGPRETGFLLFHGFTATTVEVSRLAEFINQEGFPVSAPLLAGHGTTPEDLNQVKYPQWIDQAERSLESLRKECRHVIVGGESMGAVLSLFLAAKHPEIQALLLYSPALIVPSLKYARFIRLVRSSIPKNGDDDEMPWQGYTVYPLNAAFEFYKMQQIVKKNLSDITIPTLIFHGKYDQTIDPGVSEYILKNIRSRMKRLVRMENSGHVMLLDREFDAIARTSMEFLEEKKILQTALGL